MTFTNNIHAIIGEPGAFRLRIGTWSIVIFLLEGSVMRLRLITSPGAGLQGQEVEMSKVQFIRTP